MQPRLPGLAAPSFVGCIPCSRKCINLSPTSWFASAKSLRRTLNGGAHLFHHGMYRLYYARLEFNARMDVEVWSDASGGWGCGAYWRTQWFQLPWSTVPIASHGIAAKELLPIVLAAAIWGHEWRGSTVRFHCDNSAAVAVMNNLSAHEHLLCHHLRSLFFIGARFDINIIAVHTPGVSKIAADALSRDNVCLFFSQIPHAAHRPTPLPARLAWGLCVSKPGWISRDWTAWLDSILTRP